MEKRYPAKVEAIPSAESGPNYSVPEDEKQKTPYGYGEPEMFVKQHKTLPHLKGRRVYNEVAGESTSNVPVDNQPAPVQEKPEEAKQAIRQSPSN
jgi:hypothetical protein